MTETNPEVPIIQPAPVESKKLRWLELALVLAVAFATAVFSSLYLLFHNTPRAATAPELVDARLLLTMISQATSLAVLFYVLFRQGRGIGQLGFRWNPRTLPSNAAFAFVLAIIALSATFATRFLMAALYFAMTARPLNWHSEKMPAIAVSLVAILFMILNGAFEELIVRAYAITEVEALTKNTALAVAFSVLLQTSYHFYQGAPYALSYAPLFLVFALYYVHTRNITPVVVAHIGIDMWSLFMASGHH